MTKHVAKLRPLIGSQLLQKTGHGFWGFFENFHKSLHQNDLGQSRIVGPFPQASAAGSYLPLAMLATDVYSPQAGACPALIICNQLV